MIAASPDALPDDLDALRAAVLAERAEKQLLIVERDQLSAANEKLHTAYRTFDGWYKFHTGRPGRPP